MSTVLLLQIAVIILIKRDDECIIPNGQTILQSGDQLVILDLED